MNARRWTWLLAVSPWICLAILAVMILYIYLRFTPPMVGLNTELPGSLRLLENCFGLALIETLLAAPLWIVTVCVRRFRLSTKEHGTQIAVWVAGCALGNMSPVWDPTGMAHRIFYW
ncbi:MAG: hypothetical protein ACXW32_18130 [Limisphaerales bacterium]